jgi:hypothetical protein
MASFFLFACDKKEKEEEKKSTTPKTETKKPVAKPLSMLDLVPADTIFFSGGTDPFPLKETLQWSADNFHGLKELNPETLFPIPQSEQAPAGQRMASQLWSAYYAMMLTPDTELAQWGVKEKPFMATYTVGLAPVLMRVSLQDVSAFEKKLGELETKAGVSSTVETLGKASYRRYALNGPVQTAQAKQATQAEQSAQTESAEQSAPIEQTAQNKQQPSVDLIIGVDNERKHAVFMLDIGVDSEQTIAIALGQQKPEKALAGTGRIEDLIQQYKFHPSWLGYLDHQQLITGLTTRDGNSIAKMMQILVPQTQQGTGGALEELQTEVCRNDLKAMGENWPQTVFGYTALELAASPSRIDSLIVLENKDKALLDGLQSLRGFIPQYAKQSAQPPIAAFGLGLNVEKIAPFITERWTAITQKEYSCSFFKEMQENAKSQQPAAFAMMTGMAPGVQGLGFSLMSLELEETTGPGSPPAPKSIDALISLAVKNPTTFVQMISGFFPPLAQLQIPADGTPVQLPIPVPLPFSVMAAINGSHLTVYAGEQSKALAQGLASESLESSQGLMAMNVDYGKYYGLIGNALADLDLPDDPQVEETKALLEAMQDVKMRMLMNIDVTGRGIEFQVNVTE